MIQTYLTGMAKEDSCGIHWSNSGIGCPPLVPHFLLFRGDARGFRSLARPGYHGQQRDRRTSRNPSKHRPETAALAGTEGLDPQTGPGNQSALALRSVT